MATPRPNEFNRKRREPFLDEKSYDAFIAYLIDEAIPQAKCYISSSDTNGDFIGYALHDLGSKYIDVALLRYSAGCPIEELREPFQAAIDSFRRNLDSPQPAIVYVDLAVQTYYVEALWLLTLTKLLGLGDEQIERVADFYATDETNDGADELFEALLAKLGRKSFSAEGLIHEDPYQPLLDCIKSDPTQRPALMTQFLKRWFKGQKECDWWGSHVPRKGTTVLDTGFFGYWAFEAALVTYLWDIDDTSYRNLPHYPKDLIDYARQRFPLAETQAHPLRAEAGQPCPRAGWWVTPASAGTRRRFRVGEMMPDLSGHYGATLWQWDDDQT